MTAPRWSDADKARVLAILAPHGDAGVQCTGMQPDDESCAIRLMFDGLVRVEGTAGVTWNGTRYIITSAGKARLENAEAAA